MQYIYPYPQTLDFFDPDLKMTGTAPNAFNVPKGNNLNIEVAFTLHQFGKYDTGSAVIGWKCFIKLGHHTTETGGFL